MSADSCDYFSYYISIYLSYSILYYISMIFTTENENSCLSSNFNSQLPHGTRQRNKYISTVCTLTQAGCTLYQYPLQLPAHDQLRYPSTIPCRRVFLHWAHTAPQAFLRVWCLYRSSRLPFLSAFTVIPASADPHTEFRILTSRHVSSGISRSYVWQ